MPEIQHVRIIMRLPAIGVISAISAISTIATYTAIAAICCAPRPAAHALAK